jgi:hypothetical protein
MKTPPFVCAIVAGMSTVALLGAAGPAPNGMMPAAGSSAAVPYYRSSPQGSAAAAPTIDRAMLDRYCVTCHNQRLKTANLTLDDLDAANVDSQAEIWERVLAKVKGGSMPPPGRPRPDAAPMAAFVGSVENAIDAAALRHPDPGRPVLHRLNRSEYGNAVRDLLGLEVDVRALLPADDSGSGFDNMGDVLGVSSGLMERYLSAARSVARLAVGDDGIKPSVQTFKAPKNDRQEARVSEDAPFGTRGGVSFAYLAPLDGEYAFKIRILKTLGDQDYIRGLHRLSTVDVRVDSARVLHFTIGGQLGCPVQGLNGKGCFQQLSGPAATIPDVEPNTVTFRLPLTAGRHTFTAAFLDRRLEAEGLKPRYPTGHYSFQNEIEGLPFVEAVDVDGPYEAKVPANTVASRARIFSCTPASAAEEPACARQIIARLARYAYRGAVKPNDVELLMSFYDKGRTGARPFDAGIQSAIVRMLVSPSFLFRAERDPQGTPAGRAYELSDLELASRLSFFLWSSIPDEELLSLAERGRLRDAATYDAQMQRMLADGRSAALTSNFAGQWLLLRNLQAVMPDTHEFPDFDDELRDAARRETELFFAAQIRENRPVPELLSAGYTFLNERLARHYGIPHVYGSHFRRVELSDERRSGLLGQASILTVTSYPNRTSPVLRGKWVLENILGSPPPAPPPDVPALEEQPSVKYRSMRERMDVHRKNPVCSTCHARIDPIGFAMENFDGTGQWRDRMIDTPIDVSGVLDGVRFEGVTGLRRLLMAHQEQFVASVTTRMMTYALGRGVLHTDMPAIRQVLRGAQADGYRWTSIITGIAHSTPFRMRRSDS